MDNCLKDIRSRKKIAKCAVCSDEIEFPFLREVDRKKVLSPYCCTGTVFITQWLIHHGWHVRNLGIDDSHPFICPNCWKEGTPEYTAKEYGKEWCEQAEKWMNEKE